MRRLWKALRAAGLVAIMACLSGSVADAATFTILWDRNVEPEVTGYKLSWGNASRTYSTTIDVGNEISYVFNGADPELQYYFAVQAYNALGLLSAYSVEVSWPVSTSPAVSITAPADGTMVSGSILVTASASDDVGVVGVQFTLDGAALGAEDTTAPYSVSWNTAGATIGSHTLAAIARDAAGNQTTSAPVTVTVTVTGDTTPPIISAVTASSITASGAILTWTTNEGSDSQVDFGLTTAYGSTSTLNPTPVTAHSVSLSGLTAATLYHVRVRSRDAAGNLAVSGDVTLSTLDGIAPTVSITTPAGGSTVSGSIPVTASASDNVGVVGVQFTLDGAALAEEETLLPYSVSWNTATAATGSHTLTAIARDAAGNRTTSAPVTVFVTVTNDTTPPVISGVTASSITASGATLTWTTNEASDSQVDFGLTTAYGSRSALNTALVTAHTVTLTGLTAARLYHVRVRSRDAAGNLALSGDITLTTLDGTAPTVSITAPASGATVSGSITVRANASDNVAVVGVQFTLDGAALGAEDTTSPYSVSWNTAGAASGNHTLAAIARDAAGHRTTSALVIVAVNDTMPPVISAVTSSSITASSATLTWMTNEASDSQVDFGLTTAYGSTSALNPTRVTAHSVSLGGLTAATLYHVRVRSRDAAGNLALSGDVTLTTLDATAPVVSISAPAGGVTVSGTILVTANASDDVGVLGVQFTLDGAALGAEDTTAPYSVSWNTAAAATGGHTLAAIARDGAGHRATSAPVTVTVNNDTTPPVISGVAPASITATSATLTWTTNEASDSQVDFGLTTAYGSTSALNAALVTAHSVSLSGLTAATLYHVRVRSRDAAGNLAVSGDVTLTTLDATAPVVSITAPAGGSTVSGSILVTASASDDVGVLGVQFTLDGAALGAEDTTAPYSVSWNTAGAAPGSHTLAAIARDGAGHQATSALVIVTVSNDTTPPVISAVTPSSITASGATLTWTTDEASDSQVDFGLTTAYGSTSALNAALVTAHTVSLTGLTGATLFHVRVRSRDAAGNLALSGDFIVRRPLVGDGDGDGKADLTIYRPPIGTWFIGQSGTDYGTSVAFQWGLIDDFPVPGDYDGDGKMDLAVYRPANGVWYIGQSTTNYATAVEFQWGLSGDIPIPGDYDGDAATDLAVFRPATGEWWIWQSTNSFSTFVTFQWGLGGDVPVPADYDGDGKLDLVVYRPANGVWYIRQSTTNYATAVEFQWGLSDDIAVPGDFDGDGKADLAVWRPASGHWFIRPSTTDYAFSVTVQWGLGGDIPVLGDFDGDAKSDLAVFRPSIGTWFLLLSSTNFAMSSSYQWGLPGDVPILGRQ